MEMCFKEQMFKSYHWYILAQHNFEHQFLAKIKTTKVRRRNAEG